MKVGFIGIGSAKDVDDVLFGAHGVAETLRPGSVIMMHSTVSSAEVQALARKSAAHGLRMLDAPVSGGQTQASIGKLTVMVGGEQDALADVAPVLASFSDHVVHLGPCPAVDRPSPVSHLPGTCGLFLVV
jgi:3-hydroxyisobutyrate dehydrogenase-like beta-hydroxyacid dehydrogenase